MKHAFNRAGWRVMLAVWCGLAFQSAFAVELDSRDFEVIIVPGELYTYSGGRQLVLEPSERYGAFRIEPGEQDDFARRVNETGMLDIETSGLTDRYKIVLVRIKDGIDVPGFAGAIQTLRTDTPFYHVFKDGDGDKVLINEFSLRFERDVSDEEYQHAFRAIGAKYLQRGNRGRNTFVVSFPKRPIEEALALVNMLAQRPEFRYAKPNFIRLSPRRPTTLKGAEPDQSVAQLRSQQYLTTAGIAQAWPNDPKFNLQWWLNHIHADDAWETTIGSCDMKVAIIDSGIDIEHEDLEDKISDMIDVIDEDSLPLPLNDSDWHGTASAGIAAADTNNLKGVAGTVWGGSIIAVRIFDGTPTSDVTTNIHVADGIDFAADNGAKVINNSWGDTADEDREEVNDAIDEAIEKNVVMVFAVGNKSEEPLVDCTDDHVEWPANRSANTPIIAVGAANFLDEVMGFSKCTHDADEVTLLAPGQSIDTSLNDASHQKYTEDYGYTSGAAPFVSGAAALLLSWYPGATPTQVRDWLTQNAFKPDALKDADPDNDKAYGAGRIDIGAAMAAVGTVGITVSARLVPDVILESGESAEVEVEVKRNGQPLSGVIVSFETQDAALAGLPMPSTKVVTNCLGIAIVPTTGNYTGTPTKTTTIIADVAGITESVVVRVGEPVPGGVWAALALLAIALTYAVVLWRRRIGDG